jgi:hypothetical protein
MHQAAEAQLERYLSICCQAAIERAVFSDGRGFLVCSSCARVLAVEPRPVRKTA